MSRKRIVHVIGTGTIGEPLIGLLTAFRQELGIDEVTFHKRTPLLQDRSKIVALQSGGAQLAVDDGAWDGFTALGIRPAFGALDAIERAAVVIDCTPAGNENKERHDTRFTHNAHGFVAQSSGCGFGKMYARGINDAALRPGEDRFVQVASGHAHSVAALVDTIALGPEKEDALGQGRFVCMRRAHDVSEDGDSPAAPEAGPHEDERFGTRQARDAHSVFRTMGLDLNLYSSTVKLNTQYMHVMHFSLSLRRRITLDDVMGRLRSNPRVALTHRKCSGLVFSFGRDHGLFGRILNPTVIPSHTLTIKDDRTVVGFGFTPQDGNSLLSSVAAAEWFLYPDDYERRLQCLERRMFQEI